VSGHLDLLERGIRWTGRLGCTVTKLHLLREVTVARAKMRSAYRRKRPRRPVVGKMLHQDASTHAWLPGDARIYVLGVTMADATSALYSDFLVDEEGTASSLQGLREVGGKARPFLLALHRPGQPLFLHAGRAPDEPYAGLRVSYPWIVCRRENHGVP
jgi:hypothetical protein